MALQHYIAIDLGAESGRIMLGSVDRDALTLREIHRFPNGPVRIGKSLYWDILSLWGQIQIGISKATALEPRIAGIGIDTWGVDFALLDDAGELIANPRHYRDPRTDGIADRVYQQIPRERVFAITGLQTLPFNTLFQLAAMRAGPDDAQLRRAKTLLFIPDLIAYWLTGDKTTEYTIASTSQLLDATTRDWSPELLALLDLPPELFPPIRMPATRGSLRGTVQPSVGDSLGISGVPVIAVASHDTASAVIAVPEPRNDWLFLSSGTWSLLGAEIPAPILTPAAAGYNVTNEGGVGNSIRLLKNIAGLWILQECRRAWAAAGQEMSYAELVAHAAEARPKLATIDPDDPAFASPPDMPAAIADYCRRTNQIVPTTPGEVARVVLESLANAYQKVRRVLEEITGRTYTQTHVVGGGSQNALLNQLAADALQMPVYAGPAEATALGNILGQAIATWQLDGINSARSLVAATQSITRIDPVSR